MSDEYKVLNMFSGRKAGKNMFYAQKMALQYFEKHLGKPIRIIQCDHEKITKLESQLAKVTSERDILKEACEKTKALARKLRYGLVYQYMQQALEKTKESE